TYGAKYSYTYNNVGLTKMTDGTSNTLMWAEGYSACGSSYYYDYSAYYGAGSYYKYDYKYTRVWNYDSFTSRYKSVAKYQYPYTTPPRPYVYEYTYTGETYPYFYAMTYYLPQFRPTPAQCTNYQAQSTTAGGLVVAMCDGSVRTIAQGISAN